MHKKILVIFLKRMMKAADAMAEHLCQEYPYTPTSVSQYNVAKQLFIDAVKENDGKE